MSIGKKMSAPQKRLRPATYSHRQALARMRKQPGLAMQSTDSETCKWRWHETGFQMLGAYPPWIPAPDFSKAEKAARWFDAIPQPK